MKFFNELLNDEQGATAIEYGLIAALIAVRRSETRARLTEARWPRLQALAPRRARPLTLTRHPEGHTLAHAQP